jgi:glutamate carboxypeptidase
MAAAANDLSLNYARANQKQIIHFIRELVEAESPSEDPEALASFADLFAARIADIARVRRVGAHLQCDFELLGPRKKGQLLVLGHMDTVYPLGTLAKMPFRNTKGRLWGPGVMDMKGGLAIFVYAMRAIRELELPVRANVRLQLNADEETGSASSRTLTEKEARRSEGVIVLEPGTGSTGKAKTARKGIGSYTVTVRGKAAHAGVDFSAGASAIVELARQIERIASFVDLAKGLTVNPGVIRGGIRSNVVADHAETEVDFRVSRLRDAAGLDRKFHQLRPFDKRCTIAVQGGLNRPPMERTPAIGRWFATARKMAAELGVVLEESSTGGGSDGNFTAALGVPTIDGFGVVGEGAHSPEESLIIDRIADRTALLAKLVSGF